MKSPITTHVLDTTKGVPAKGLAVLLELRDKDRWFLLGQGVTDADGRVMTLLPPEHELRIGTYRLTFAVGAWQEGFYPEVAVTFSVKDPERTYHVPLLLNPFGYSTYRGS